MFTTGHAKNTARNATGGASSAALLTARLTSWSTEHHVGPPVDPALAVGVDLVGRELVDLIGRHGVLPELRRELDAAAPRVHEHRHCHVSLDRPGAQRPEERRVGNGCGSTG